MKKILSITLVLTLLLGAVCIFPASAGYDEESIKSGDFYYEILDDGTASIVYYEGNATRLTFPTEIDGIKVTEIKNPFYHYDLVTRIENTTIKSVTVPEGILRCSLGGALNLEEIKLPQSLEMFNSSGIEKSAFYQNPENWEDGVLYLGDRLIKIDEEKAPAKVKIKEGTRVISGEAAYGNHKITEVTLPDSLERIEEGGFRFCLKLSKINFGKNLKFIGIEAFRNDEAIKEITFPDSLETIEKNAFDHCKGLSKITFGKGLKYIGDTAFDGCQSLTEITLPESLEHLGFCAFNRCYNLEEVNLPSNLLFIGSNVFQKTAYIENPDIYEDGLLYYGDYLLDHNGKLKGACNVKEGTKVIADMMFLGCENITSITLPDGIEGIGERFFEGCHKLESVKLPAGMDTIYSEAFRDCNKLKSIVIPEGVTEIDENAFVNCESLEYVELPSTIEKIAYYSIGFSFSYPITVNNMYEKYSHKVQIAGYRNTVAELYAEMFTFNFTDISEEYKEQVINLLGLTEEDPLTHYREAYRHFTQSAENEATPDYVLIYAHTAESGDALAAERFGDYILRTDEHHFPATYGYLIYQPKLNKIYSLEEAYALNIEGIENVFTKGGIGELIGDVNYDRTLNIKDATLIQKAVANMAEIKNNYIEGTVWSNSENMPSCIADFNCDGKMNIRDATAIQKKLANIPTN